MSISMAADSTMDGKPEDGELKSSPREEREDISSDELSPEHLSPPGLRVPDSGSVAGSQRRRNTRSRSKSRSGSRSLTSRNRNSSRQRNTSLNESYTSEDSTRSHSRGSRRKKKKKKKVKKKTRSRASPSMSDRSESSQISIKERQKTTINPRNLDLNMGDALFFVMKSFSEEDIHRAIKYNLWCSTTRGNRKLDKAYRDPKRKGAIYLFYSVNGSGHFCGMAQMMSSIDYTKTVPVWAQDIRWKGRFDIEWIYIKDVPNVRLRHIRLENNEDKPITFSRDAQEVPRDKGIKALKVIHYFRNRTSIVDDFAHYEKLQIEEKAAKGLIEDESCSDHASDLDLDTELLPISGYIKDRESMVVQMFRSISVKKLRAMLPDILKDYSLDKLKTFCLEQLEVMSKKRILGLLEGVDPELISSSGTEDGDSDTEQEKQVQTLELDQGDSEGLQQSGPVSSDDEIEISDEEAKDQALESGMSDLEMAEESRLSEEDVEEVEEDAGQEEDLSIDADVEDVVLDSEQDIVSGEEDIDISDVEEDTNVSHDEDIGYEDQADEEHGYEKYEVEEGEVDNYDAQFEKNALGKVAASDRDGHKHGSRKKKKIKLRGRRGEEIIERVHWKDIKTEELDVEAPEKTIEDLEQEFIVPTHEIKEEADSITTEALETVKASNELADHGREITSMEQSINTELSNLQSLDSPHLSNESAAGEDDVQVIEMNKTTEVIVIEDESLIQEEEEDIENKRDGDLEEQSKDDTDKKCELDNSQAKMIKIGGDNKLERPHHSESHESAEETKYLSSINHPTVVTGAKKGHEMMKITDDALAMVHIDQEEIVLDYGTDEYDEHDSQRKTETDQVSDGNDGNKSKSITDTSNLGPVPKKKIKLARSTKVLEEIMGMKLYNEQGPRCFPKQTASTASTSTKEQTPKDVTLSKACRETANRSASASNQNQGITRKPVISRIIRTVEPEHFGVTVKRKKKVKKTTDADDKRDSSSNSSNRNVIDDKKYQSQSKPPLETGHLSGDGDLRSTKNHPDDEYSREHKRSGDKRLEVRDRRRVEVGHWTRSHSPLSRYDHHHDGRGKRYHQRRHQSSSEEDSPPPAGGLKSSISKEQLAPPRTEEEFQDRMKNKIRAALLPKHKQPAELLPKSSKSSDKSSSMVQPNLKSIPSDKSNQKSIPPEQLAGKSKLARSSDLQKLSVKSPASAQKREYSKTVGDTKPSTKKKEPLKGDAAESNDSDVEISETQMEILELEMRARAIKAMLKAQEWAEKRKEALKGKTIKVTTSGGKVITKVAKPDPKVATKSIPVKKKGPDRQRTTAKKKPRESGIVHCSSSRDVSTVPSDVAIDKMHAHTSADRPVKIKKEKL